MTAFTSFSRDPLISTTTSPQNLIVNTVNPDALENIEGHIRNQEAVLGGILQHQIFQPQQPLAAEGAAHSAELAAEAFQSEAHACRDEFQQRACGVEKQAMAAVCEARTTEANQIAAMRQELAEGGRRLENEAQNYVSQNLE